MNFIELILMSRVCIRYEICYRLKTKDNGVNGYPAKNRQVRYCFKKNVLISNFYFYEGHSIIFENGDVTCEVSNIIHTSKPGKCHMSNVLYCMV